MSCLRIMTYRNYAILLIFFKTILFYYLKKNMLINKNNNFIWTRSIHEDKRAPRSIPNIITIQIYTLLIKK
jgi:hypothetical protein